MGFFSQTGTLIEAGATSQIAAVSSSISATLIPWVTGGITLWILSYAYAVIRGEAQEPVNRFCWEVAKKSLIVYFALTVGVFQSTIMADTETVTRQLTSAINNSTGGTCAVAQAGAAIYDAIDCSYLQYQKSVKDVFKSEQKLWEKDSGVLDFLDKLSASIMLIILAVISFFLLTVFSVLMYALMFVEVVTVRITLALIFALAPLFISALLFEPTKKYFEGWLSKLVYCVILQVMLILFIGITNSIMTGIATEYVNVLQFITDFEVFVFSNLGLSLLYITVFIALGFIFFRLPHIAGDLTGHSSGSSGIAGFLAATGTRSGLAKGLQAIRNLSQKKPGGTMEG